MVNIAKSKIKACNKRYALILSEIEAACKRRNNKDDLYQFFFNLT